MKEADGTMTVPQAAAALMVGPETVRVWLREGKLHGYRLGGTKTGWRIPAAEITQLKAVTLSRSLQNITSIRPAQAMTVLVEQPGINAVRCGACGTLLERGQSCDHLTFASEPGTPSMTVTIT